jgi:hypothetical protein
MDENSSERDYEANRTKMEALSQLSRRSAGSGQGRKLGSEQLSQVFSGTLRSQALGTEPYLGADGAGSWVP